MDTESTIFIESKWYRAYIDELPHYIQLECTRDINVHARIGYVRTLLLRNIYRLSKNLEPDEQTTIINMVNNAHISEMDGVLRNYVMNKLIGASYGRETNY